MRHSQKDTHVSIQKASENQDLAAHVAHSRTTQGHGKEDNLTRHERSKQALKQSKNPYPQTLQTDEPDEQQIAALAYVLWQARGCPEGSPQEDWSSAVQQLRYTVKNH